MATPLEQLDAMRNLQPNWDGYNADPPSHAVLDVAKDFVRLLTAFRGAAPSGDIEVYPGRAGGVQVSWEDVRTRHELDIEPDGTWDFLHIDKQTDEMTQRTFKPTNQAIHPGVLRELREMVAA
jgi:hypothetical protein